MYSLDDIKVTLLNPDEVQHFIRNHGYIACICYDTDERFAERVGENCLESGHLSGSRGDYFKFEIECPRFTADQIMRHEQGVFKNCQSQRYVDMDNFDCYMPPKVEKDFVLSELYEDFEKRAQHYYRNLRYEMQVRGINGEQANDLMRSLLPIGVKTKLRIGFDIEALMHFMNKRLCVRADEPIRRVAQLMKKEVLEVEPRYAEYLVPQCQAMMYCPEHKGCGAYPSKENAMKVLNTYRSITNSDSKSPIRGDK